MKRLRLIAAIVVFVVGAAPALTMRGAPAAAKDARVAILSIVRGYAPASVTVASGETVIWENEDPNAMHNAVCDNTCPAPFRSSDSAPKGPAGSHRFTKLGTYKYFCELHPNMKAEVIVVEAAQPAATTTTAPARPQATTTSSTATTAAPTATTSSTTTPAVIEPAPENNEALPAEIEEDEGGDGIVPIVVAAVLAATALLSYLLTRARSPGR